MVPAGVGLPSSSAIATAADIRGRGVRDIPGDSVEEGVILGSRVQYGISPASRLVNPGSQIARTARAEIGHDDRAVSEQRAEMLAIQDPVHVDLPPAARGCLRYTEQRTHALIPKDCPDLCFTQRRGR